MEFPTFKKEVNGHSMSIHFHGDDENITEVVLWCHTCDPEGKNQVSRQVENNGALKNEVSGLMESAEEHAKV